ncbi:MAG: glucose 1-dehydrogenase [Candidatus Omnitrophica bacterium]|nr:glucose 1-dehydrogenase [Candidatus Omnitrophota bacterium]MBU2251251.1 glucose 1-dehydrogenase [Candidatus Omnitrophota bacterium]
MAQEYALKDKVAIISGAGKGIGRETAKLFYKEGANIALISRNLKDLSSLKEEVSFDSKRIFLYEGDVSKEEVVEKFVKQTIEKFNKIDLLINNAGMRFRKKFLDTNSQEWNQVISNNLNSVYFFCREVGKSMVSKKSGKIINISSIVGTLGLPELSAYGASKGAIITLSKCLALEWAEHNINVNTIAPGFCQTSYFENFKKKEDLYKFTIERTPQKKWGSSLDVANCCLFLASEASNYITGEVLNVDGGWSAW